MILGYRSAELVPVWYPPAFMVHINNLLVLVAIYMMSPAPKKGALLNGVRHPMLTGFALWALAHLLVNGNLESLVLFGGLWAWAIVSVKMINAAQPVWEKPEVKPAKKEVIGVVAALVVYGAIIGVHLWFGLAVFG